MQTKALLFDFDGTLLNTNDLIIQTFMHVLEGKFPGQYSAEHCLQFIGPSLRETFSDLTPGEEDAMIANYQLYNEKHHDALATAYEGVVETLHKLYNDGIRLVIVSTKSQAGLERGMKLLGVGQLFEFYIGYDDVEHVKPHPEPIFKALERLNLQKEDVIMIGDNSHDIEAGHNAGVRTAGVAWSLRGKDYLMQYKPTYMLEQMQDLLAIVKGE